MRIPRSILRLGDRLTIRPLLDSRLPVPLKRRGLAALSVISLPPRGISRHRGELGGVAVETSVPGAAKGSDSPPGGVAGRSAILYLHGGAYVVGAPRTHRGIAGHMCKATGAAVHVPDYRLAPEHPYPAAVEDALACYRSLLEQDIPAGSIAVGGDSAGGGLTLAMLAVASREGVAMPGCCVLISPWVDLTLDGESIGQVGRRDALLGVPALERSREAYAAGRPYDEPGISPLYGELGHLPPTLVQVGTDEVLRSDAERLAGRAQAAGVEIELSLFDGLWHDFHVHAGLLPEADQAFEQIGAFVRSHLAGG